MTLPEPAIPWSTMTKREVTETGVREVAHRFRREGFKVGHAGAGRLLTSLRVQGERGRAYDVRVATLRPPRGAYTYFRKDSFDPADTLLAALVLLEEGRQPSAFLIPSTAWREPTPLLRDRDYEGKASAPEWGIQISGKSRPFLEEFSFANQARLL